jgi:receptor tyrosine kinase-like orphan receptor 1
VSLLRSIFNLHSFIYASLLSSFCQGDLHEFLISHSPRSDGSACSDDGNVHVLEQPEFLHIALQIAAGKLNPFSVSHFY